jgi:hypothetical protein
MAFPAIQAAYAAHGVATYPLTAGKKPAVRAYDRIGAPHSAQLALKFAAATAAGFVAGWRNRLAIGDIDSTDDRLVAEFQKKYGVTPLQVLTPSGGSHLYYRHSGETRRIHLLDDVDLLGAGHVVAAGSRVPAGRYEIVRGSLDDLDRLPRLAATVAPPAQTRDHIPEGKRDDTLFRLLLREARHCDDFETLLDVGKTLNMNCVPPLDDNHVISKVKSAWKYETTGLNWVGRKARASTDREEILAFSRNPAAALLLSLLRVSHPVIGTRFAVDQVKTAELLDWSRATLISRIRYLIENRRLIIVHRGRGKGDPHLYELVR